jgi:hypothetical protein
MTKHERKALDKSACQRAHAKARAYERYGLSLNRIDYMELVSMIQRGGSKYILTQSRRRSVHLLYSRWGTLLVAYDSHRKNICTFLPRALIPQVIEFQHDINILKDILTAQKDDGDDASF